MINDVEERKERFGAHEAHSQLDRATDNVAILWKYWLQFANNGDNTADFAIVAAL